MIIKTSIYLKKCYCRRNYSYHDSQSGNLLDFEKHNVLFNYEVFDDKIFIGKFLCIAEGTTFIMSAANHNLLPL